MSDSMQRKTLIRFVLLGFVLAFVVGFVFPVFLNPKEHMIFFKTVLPMRKIGMDLRALLKYCTAWAVDGGSPYIEIWIVNPYPPLCSVLFSPLVWMSFKSAFTLLTGLTLTSYFLSFTVFLNRIVGEIEEHPLVYLFIASGLFSYGLHFEIERGQFNLLAVGFALGAIALWRSDAPLFKRLLAYLFMSISIQMKLFPAVFALCLTDDLRDWKRNAIRLFSLGLVNMMALFFLGLDVFKDFVFYLNQVTEKPDFWLWVGAHSIASFAHVTGYPTEPFWAILILCFGLIYLMGFLNNWSGRNIYLLLACCSVALLAPTISHDYKLSIFHPIVCIFMVGFVRCSNPIRLLRIAEYIIITMMSFFACITNYSYKQKKIWPLEEKLYWNNMLPILFVLICATLLLLIREHGPTLYLRLKKRS